MKQPAADATKTALENAIYGLIDDVSAVPTTPITTKKYLTGDNRLVYLTLCSVTESSMPRVRVQVLSRVEGGVHETNFALFTDRRFEVSQNPMIFGSSATQTVEPAATVDEATAQQLLSLIGHLPDAQLKN